MTLTINRYSATHHYRWKVMVTCGRSPHKFIIGVAQSETVLVRQNATRFSTIDEFNWHYYEKGWHQLVVCDIKARTDHGVLYNYLDAPSSVAGNHANSSMKR
ncbi:unnamed protein product [Vicia faba]|uniref:Uncharacterized protein n=1 Tax=Vicia faba TaxID=3906 RepID=A0AAV0ZD99_VICFA|nr:unnamed protein product [Vicia faba]